jgi:CTP-dependent riboflavin kinase
MNAKHEIIIRAAIAPINLKTLIQTTDYTAKAIYKAVSKLHKQGLIAKISRKDTTTIALSSRYKASKTAELYFTAFIHGIDPKIFDCRSFHQIWQCLHKHQQVDIKKCQKQTNYHYQTILQTFKTLQNTGLAKNICENPIIIHLTDHPVNHRLHELHQPEQHETITTSGYPIIKETYATPETIRKYLHNEHDKTYLHDTITSIPHQEFLEILHSTPTITPEQVFINALHTGHGVEETCILLLKRRQLNMKKLLDIAKEKDETNIVGCYLDIIHGFNTKLVSQKIINQFFHEKKDGKTKIWLKSEKQYGKKKWSISYEKKWNLDIYVDIDAIRHTLRGEM